MRLPRLSDKQGFAQGSAFADDDTLWFAPVLAIVVNRFLQIKM
jgi:hypothetical protein